MTELFVNAAADICTRKESHSCVAIFNRVGGPSRAAERFSLMFMPRAGDGWYPYGYTFDCPWWWNGSTTDALNREARIYALLLAHEMHRTKDL